MTSDVKLAQRMEAPKSPYTKGAWYGTFRFQKGADHSFCLRDDKRHTALRTKIGPGYSASHLVVSKVVAFVYMHTRYTSTRTRTHPVYPKHTRPSSTTRPRGPRPLEDGPDLGLANTPT